MQSCLILVLAVSFVSRSQQTRNGTENGEASAGLRAGLLENMDAGNLSSHVHVHNGTTVTSSDVEIRRAESAYFVSALFQKYNDSKTLSLDGFTRLLCSLGLVPAFTETTNEADDNYRVLLVDDGGTGKSKYIPGNSTDCGKVTFDGMQALFEERAARKREHAHGEEEEHGHEHGDEHGDHDHQPNRLVGGAKSSSAGGGHTHHHDDDAEHRDSDDHGDHNHESHHRDDKPHHNDDSSDTNKHHELSPSTNRRRRDAGQGSDSSRNSGPDTDTDSHLTIHVHSNLSTVSPDQCFVNILLFILLLKYYSILYMLYILLLSFFLNIYLRLYL